MHISQRKAGVILSYTSEAIKILTGLVYTPIMLRLLGQSEYGLYQLVYSVVSYLSLLSLGFGSAYIRFYARYKADKDEDGVARLNGMFLIIFSVISVICMLCGVVMLINIKPIFGTGLTETEVDKARILMGLMIINLVLTFPNSVFNCAITAHEQFIFQKALIVLQSLFNPFLTLPLLIMGCGSLGMVSVTTILTLAVLISNITYSFKKIHIRFLFNGFHMGLLKEMWIFTFFIFLNQIIDQINWSVDKFLLGRFIGTTAVAVYGVGGQINTMYLQFSTSISNVFTPEVNRIVAESDNSKELTVLFTKVGRVQFIIMTLILSGFILFGKPFILWWAGKDYLDAYYVTIFLILPVTVPLIQNLGIEIQRAKNKHRTRSVVYLGISILNVMISIPLIKFWGPIGAAIGTAIAIFLGNILFMNVYYHYQIGLDMMFFWRSICELLPSMIGTFIVGGLLAKFISYDNFLVLVVGIILYVVVYCGGVWIWGLNEYEKNIISRSSIKIINKLKEERS